MTNRPDDGPQVLDLVADLLPVLLPDASLDRAGPTVTLRWRRGGLVSTAEVGLVELVDRCRAQPNHLWPRTVDDWLRAVVAEIGVATDEHMFGDVTPRQRAVLVPLGWSARTGGLLADVVVPFGQYFEILFGIEGGGDWRRLTQVRRIMHGLHLPDRPSGLELTLAGLDGLTAAPVPDTPWSVFHRPDDRYVAMGLVDHERLLPGAGRGRGTLLAVPRASLLAVCPVDRGADMQSRADAFARWVSTTYAEADDQCSPGVYWLVQDLLADLPVDLDRTPAVSLPRPLRTPIWRRLLNR